MQVKRILLPAITAMGMLVAGNAHARDINVMTYNVRSGLGLDRLRTPERSAAVIAGIGPDIVAVQEVDSATRRSSNQFVLGEIAARTAMMPLFAPAIDHDGGRYGIGLLSRKAPISTKSIALPGSEEPRRLIIAEFDDFVAVCTHLSLTPADALASTDIIRREAASYAPKPFILMGDFNSVPDSEVIKRLKEDFVMIGKEGTPTFPADNPDRQLDYIMVANCPDVYGHNVRVIADTISSDHRPVVATISIPTPVEEIFGSNMPYLQNVTPDGATIMYQTNVLCSSKVEFGTDTADLKSARQLVGGQEMVHDIQHKVRLDSLIPGATYFYRVRAREILDNQAYFKRFGREAVTPFYSFKVPEKNCKDFTALILNDLHGNKVLINAMSRLAADIPHDLIIFNGDCLSEPSSRAAAIADLQSLVHAFDLADNHGLFIRGNHEIRNAYSSGAPSLFDRPDDVTYGAFTLGDIRFVTLDCGEDKPDDTWVYYGLNDFTDLRRQQADFLKKEIKSKNFKKASRHLLIHHIPVWGNTDKYQPCTEMWAPLLAKTGFDADIAGHTHRYNVIKAKAQGNPALTIVGGGPELNAATMTVVEKKGDKLEIRVLDASGSVLDKFEL